MQEIGVLTGKTLGDYLLGTPLGDDGFGPIYQATHQNLGRLFALRTLSDRFTFASGFQNLFSHMAQVVAALEHPNLLTLDDFGTDGPYVYLVTPFVETISLEQWLRQHAGQALMPAQISHLFGQALKAFQCAHEAGVTHLGLTAQHILLEPNGRLLVANLGLSYLAEHLWIAWNGRRSFGDPRYLAPEQFPGRTPAAVAADMYSLGVVLARLLTGALPYEGPPQAILSAKVEGPPALRARVPALPPALESVVQRALMPSPGDRWPDVAAFSEAFHLALQESGHAPPELVGSVPAQALPAEPALVSGALAPMLPGEYANGGPLSHPRPDARPMLRPERPLPPVEVVPAPAVTWGSAGKGRSVPPPPPPGWRPMGQHRPAQHAGAQKPQASFRPVISLVVRTIIVLLTLGVLGTAIFYGYNRWRQIQPPPSATPAPVVSPAPTST